MSIHYLKYPVILWFFAAFCMTTTSAWAQTSDYEMVPRIRSYLNRPDFETNRYIEDVRVPRITEEGTRRELGEELPEVAIPEIPAYPEIMLDRRIDPTQYIVGPGDLIKTYLWGELDRGSRYY